MRIQLRIERRFNLRQGRSHLLQHAFQHMIAANAQLLSHDLKPGMSVADVPSKPHQIACTVGRDLGQRLRNSLHGDNRAVVEHKAIAIAQCDGTFEVEQERRAVLSRQNDSPTVTVIGIENHAIDGFDRVPFTCRFDL